MNTQDLAAEIKRLQTLIDYASEDMKKGGDVNFFRSVIQQYAIQIHQVCSLQVNSASQTIEKKNEMLLTEIKPDLTASEPETDIQVIKLQETKQEPLKNIVPNPAPISTRPVQPQTYPVAEAEVKPSVHEKTHPLQEEEFSINEKLSKNKKPVINIAEKSKETPINDISKAISIAKKFEFINGLFDGNSDAYKTAISTLQNASSYEEATRYVESNFVSPYEWDENEKLSAEFFSLIRRRFIS